jgi:hypothetical protein
MTEGACADTRRCYPDETDPHPSRIRQRTDQPQAEAGEGRKNKRVRGSKNSLAREG